MVGVFQARVAAYDARAALQDVSTSAAGADTVVLDGLDLAGVVLGGCGELHAQIR